MPNDVPEEFAALWAGPKGWTLTYFIESAQYLWSVWFYLREWDLFFLHEASATFLHFNRARLHLRDRQVLSSLNPSAPNG